MLDVIVQHSTQKRYKEGYCYSKHLNALYCEPGIYKLQFLFLVHYSTDSDAAVVRERLENDLNSTKAALRKTVREREDGHEDDDSVVDTFHEERMHPELEVWAIILTCL